MAFSAGRERAIDAAKDVVPTAILADLTTPWNLLGVGLVAEIVVVTVDLQSLLELCQLLLARTRIRGKMLGDATSCTDAHASGSTCLKVSLVVVSAGTFLPFRSATIAEFCFAATTIVTFSYKGARLKLSRTHRMWWQPKFKAIMFPH